jgi:hypothetical protein
LIEPVMAALCRTSAQSDLRPADAATLALTFEAALLAPRWPDFAGGLEVLAHDITTERMVELPNDNESG